MLFLICQPFQSLAIIKLRALSLLQKTFQNRDQLFLYTDPDVFSLLYKTTDIYNLLEKSWTLES